MKRLLTLLVALSLSGCAAFIVERGEVVAPTRSLARPTVTSLPDQARFADLSTQWRREGRIGVGGHVEATMLDPLLAAAQVSHEAAVQGLDRMATTELLTSRWLTFFGVDQDRWPIDLDWRFDEQFISNAKVLDPTRWTFVLRGSDGRAHKPLAVSVLTAGRVPEDGYWVGKVRVWFPYRDAEKAVVLLGGETSRVELELRHASGDVTLTWRFHNAF